MTRVPVVQEFEDLQRVAAFMDSDDWVDQLSTQWTRAMNPSAPGGITAVPSMRVLDLPGERAQETVLRAAEAMAQAQGLRLRVDPVGTEPLGAEDLAVFTFGMGAPTDALTPEGGAALASTDLGLTLDRIDRAIGRARGAVGALFLVQGLGEDRPAAQQAIRQALADRRLRQEGVHGLTVYCDNGVALNLALQANARPADGDRFSANANRFSAFQDRSAAGPLGDLPLVLPRSALERWMPRALAGTGLSAGKVALKAYFTHHPERFNQPQRGHGVGAHAWEAALPLLDILARRHPFLGREAQATSDQAERALLTVIGPDAAAEVSVYMRTRATLSTHINMGLESLTQHPEELSSERLIKRPLIDRSSSHDDPATKTMIEGLLSETIAVRIASTLLGGLPSSSANGPTDEGLPVKTAITLGDEQSATAGWGLDLAIMMAFAAGSQDGYGGDPMVRFLEGPVLDTLAESLPEGLGRTSELAAALLLGAVIQMERSGLAQKLDLNVSTAREQLIGRCQDRYSPRRLNLARQRPAPAPAVSGGAPGRATPAPGP